MAMDGDEALTDDLPDYRAPAEEPRRRGRPVGWLLGVVVVTLALAGAILAVRHAGHDGERTAPTTPDSAVAEVQIAPQAAWDGKASQRLPVRVTPDVGLREGSVVTVEGDGFRPNAQVGVVQCTNAAVYAGVDACDIAGVVYATADARGHVEATWQIRRVIHPSSFASQPPTEPPEGAPWPNPQAGQYDCANGDVHPDDWAAAVDAYGPVAAPFAEDAFTCIVAVGELNDYDRSGGWPIAFDGAPIVRRELVPVSTTVTTAGPDATTTAPGSAPSTSVAPSPSTTAMAPAPDVVVPDEQQPTTSVVRRPGPTVTTVPPAEPTDPSLPVEPPPTTVPLTTVPPG